MGNINFKPLQPKFVSQRIMGEFASFRFLCVVIAILVLGRACLGYGGGESGWGFNNQQYHCPYWRGCGSFIEAVGGGTGGGTGSIGIGIGSNVSAGTGVRVGPGGLGFDPNFGVGIGSGARAAGVSAGIGMGGGEIRNGRGYYDDDNEGEDAHSEGNGGGQATGNHGADECIHHLAKTTTKITSNTQP
ncbi:glycine-rich protein DOT1-like [Momordica charantia]|uniref:Glycine-rich protein DOT1-like n=1 Tax=Momordica charantia TaxID=3673 RepID=A0A6J1CE99_MOMCH|nr:glycine-rich protein DOT1-like [Momordica charantia]